MTESTNPHALIVSGGWPGHRPREISEIMARELARDGVSSDICESLEVLSDGGRLAGVQLVVLNWHMGVEAVQTSVDLAPLREAVFNGTGLAGIHAGLGDAFRLDVEFQFMVGGQWVAHPGDDGVRYTVKIADRSHPIAEGLDDFVVTSEKYYMHFDPAVHVIATTDFDGVKMPIAWTKEWGTGRIFYSSLGHTPTVVELPPALALMRNGLRWAVGERSGGIAPNSAAVATSR